MLNDDYTQPFFVPQEKRHLFRGINPSGYLPPLEPHIGGTIPEPQYIVKGLTSQERDEFNQIKASFLYLDKKINEHIKLSKPTPKEKKPKGIVPL